MQALSLKAIQIRAIQQRITGAITSPNYDWITRPLMAFLVTRLIVWFCAYLAEVAIPGITGDGLYHVDINNVFLDVWARWDSGFYLRIAEQGYVFVVGQQSSVAFFPVYPILINVLAPLFNGSTLAAGVLVSNACLLGALIFLYRITKLEFNDIGTATRAVFYIAAFPTAFFFSAVYTESTFLFFSVATLYFARRQLWFWAMFFGVICSAARIVGFLICLVVILEWMRAHGWTLGGILRAQAWRNLFAGIRRDWPSLIAISLIPAGLFSYMVFLYRQFGDPVAFSTTQSAWGRKSIGILGAIMRDFGGIATNDFMHGRVWYQTILNITAFFVVVLVSIAIWKRLGTSYALYSLISVAIPMTSGSGSMSRYALVVFPVFMMLAHWGRRAWLDRILMIGFSVVLGLLTTIFVNWIFVA